VIKVLKLIEKVVFLFYFLKKTLNIDSIKKQIEQTLNKYDE
jgi:hypothetical protein